MGYGAWLREPHDYPPDVSNSWAFAISIKISGNKANEVQKQRGEHIETHSKAMVVDDANKKMST